MIPDSYDLCPVRRERSTSLVASGGRQRSRRRGNQGGREGNGHLPDATARQNGSAAVSRSVSGRAPRSELPVEVRGDEENAAERERIRSHRVQKLGDATGGYRPPSGKPKTDLARATVRADGRPLLELPAAVGG